MDNLFPIEDAGVPADDAGPEVEPYPADPVGSLMRDRDLARESATNARAAASRYTQFAIDADARADALQAAIDSLGGSATA